jgi:Ethylbenzene dehydrogenase
MNRRKALSFGLVLTAALLLTLLKVPLASSQGVTLVAAQVTGDLPVNDPNAEMWQKATALQVPLSAQTVTKPVLRETKVKSVSVRALHNDKQVAFLVEWDDDTKNDSMVRVQDFRDAVALQFPQVQGQPFFCMGMLGGNVNIWHWKADWQTDIAAWQDVESQYPNMNVDQYPFAEGDRPSPADYQDANYLPAMASNNLFAMPRVSPVEDLVAGGFGTLTSEGAAGQNVQGYGVWENDRWRVIFSRDLTSSEADDVSFATGQVYSVAFAAWDGANGERNGMKSTSQWTSLQLEGAGAAAPAAGQAQVASLPVNLIMSIVIGVLVLLMIVGAIIYIRLPDGG